MRESGVIAGASDFRGAQPAAGAARRDAKNTAVAVFPEIEHFATFKPVERSLLRFRKGAKAPGSNCNAAARFWTQARRVANGRANGRIASCGGRRLDRSLYRHHSRR